MEGLNKDERNIIYGKLTNIERELWFIAHNPKYPTELFKNSSFTIYCAKNRFLELLIWAESCGSLWRVEYFNCDNMPHFFRCSCNNAYHVHPIDRSTRFIITRIDNPKSSAQ